MRKLKHKRPLRCRVGYHRYQYRFNNGRYTWWTGNGAWFDIRALEGRECKDCHDFIPVEKKDGVMWYK
jgi:hypothetical protein